MIADPIKCPQCGLSTDDPLTQKVPLERGGYHLKACCPSCGGYIKFMSHEELSIWFGKYKGQTVANVVENDPSYAKWLTEQTWLKPNLKNSILKALPTQPDDTSTEGSR